jgi:ribonucleoside-diphosphate reductase alpha chain
MTVYREGSRSGVLVSDKKRKKSDVCRNSRAQTPRVLHAVVFSFMNNDERWVAVIGMYAGKPYEIFTGRAVDSFSVLTQVSEGKVIKIKENGKNRYDFQYTDKDGYKVTIEGLSRTFEQRILELRQAHFRRIAPRHAPALCGGYGRKPAPRNSLAQQLEKRSGARPAQIHSRRHGAFAQHLPGLCKMEGLVYQEGCLHCKNCGHSECA